MLADMSTILEILDITEASIPQVESNDHYQRKKAEFLSIFDYICGGNRMERYRQQICMAGSTSHMDGCQPPELYLFTHRQQNHLR